MRHALDVLVVTLLSHRAVADSLRRELQKRRSYMPSCLDLLVGPRRAVAVAGKTLQKLAKQGDSEAVGETLVAKGNESRAACHLIARDSVITSRTSHHASPGFSGHHLKRVQRTCAYFLEPSLLTPLQTALGKAETRNTLHDATEKRRDQQQRGDGVPPPSLTPSYVRYTPSSPLPAAGCPDDSWTADCSAKDVREGRPIPGRAHVVVAHQQAQPIPGCPWSCSSPMTLTYLHVLRGNDGEHAAAPSRTCRTDGKSAHAPSGPSGRTAPTVPAATATNANPSPAQTGPGVRVGACLLSTAGPWSRVAPNRNTTAVTAPGNPRRPSRR